jgi:hypothetical protein
VVKYVLGWIMDLDVIAHPRWWQIVLEYTLEKYDHFKQLFDPWAVARRISVKDLTRIQGIMQFLSSDMCARKAYIVAPLIAARRLAERNLVQNPNRTLILVPDPATNAIKFFRCGADVEFFSNWIAVQLYLGSKDCIQRPLA